MKKIVCFMIAFCLLVVSVPAVRVDAATWWQKILKSIGQVDLGIDFYDVNGNSCNDETMYVGESYVLIIHNIKKGSLKITDSKSAFETKTLGSVSRRYSFYICTPSVKWSASSYAIQVTPKKSGGTLKLQYELRDSKNIDRWVRFTYNPDFTKPTATLDLDKHQSLLKDRCLEGTRSYKSLKHQKTDLEYNSSEDMESVLKKIHQYVLKSEDPRYDRLSIAVKTDSASDPDKLADQIAERYSREYSVCGLVPDVKALKSGNSYQLSGKYYIFDVSFGEVFVYEKCLLKMYELAGKNDGSGYSEEERTELSAIKAAGSFRTLSEDQRRAVIEKYSGFFESSYVLYANDHDMRFGNYSKGHYVGTKFKPSWYLAYDEDDFSPDYLKGYYIVCAESLKSKLVEQFEKEVGLQTTSDTEKSETEEEEE